MADEDVGREADGFGDYDLQESFGDFLKKHREASGKSLDSVARSTRIPKRYLQAFEENNSAQFPEETFTRGFLRSYAIEIGLDVEEVLARYDRLKRAMMPTQIKEMKKPGQAIVLGDTQASLKMLSQWGPRFGLIAVIVVGLFLVIGGWRFLSQSSSQSEDQVAESTEVPPPATEVAPVDATPAEITTQSSEKLVTPAPPSALVVTALKATSLSVRLDDHPTQEMSLEEGQSQTFQVMKEVELRSADRRALQFSYNGKPLEVSGPVIKLFNPYLFSPKNP
jgi:cytoskeletal protein RodZ